MKELLKKSFEIGSIKVDIDNPFTWASGYRMPIYNDNRMLMFHPEVRKLIVTNFTSLIDKHGIEFDVIAGTATAGIPHATSLADYLGKPLTYVRTSQKDHGLHKVVEGVSSYEGKKVLLIEDLISTGKSSENALQVIREHCGVVTDCVAIFSYQFITSLTNCNIHTILSFADLKEHLKYNNLLTEVQSEEFEKWHTNPFTWGGKR